MGWGSFFVDRDDEDIFIVDMKFVKKIEKLLTLNNSGRRAVRQKTYDQLKVCIDVIIIDII